MVASRRSMILACVAATSVHAQDVRVSGPTDLPLVFDHVTVVDVERGVLLRERRVIVTGTRITAVDSTDARRPPVMRLVDGTGKYLMPGLWDMHAHLLPSERRPHAPQAWFPTTLATGVIGVRDMGSHADTLGAVRSRLNRERPLAPRLLTPGPVLDGPPGGAPYSWIVGTADGGRRATDVLARAGVDFVRVGALLSRDAYLAIADQAKRRGMTLAGDVPASVSSLEASGAGQRSLEGLSDLAVSCSSMEDSLRRARRAPAGGHPSVIAAPRAAAPAGRTTAMRTHDEAKCRRFLRALAREGAWLVPMLASELPLVDTVRAPRGELGFAEDTSIALWRADAAALAPAARRADDERPMLDRLVKLAHEEGVPMLAGTGAGDAFLVPGFALHHELALLVRAGLTPAQALRTATLEPARFLAATDSMGTVAVGRVADLVLLDADPLADIANTTRIRAVVANGRYIDRAAIDALLAGAARVASRPPVP